MINNIKNNFIGSGFVTLIIIVIIALGAIILSPISANADTPRYAVLPYNEPQVPKDLRYLNPNYDNNDSGYDNYNVARNPIPFINSISPSTVNLNSSGTTMSVYGGNFVRGSVIRINGYDRTTNYVNSGQLTTQLSYNDTANIGSHSVNVWSGGPGGGTSNTTYLNIKSATVSGSVKGASTSVARTKTSTVNNKSTSQNDSMDTGNDYGALAGNAVFGSNTFLPSGLMQWLLFAILILLIVIITRKIFVGDDERNKPLKHA